MSNPWQTESCPRGALLASPAPLAPSTGGPALCRYEVRKKEAKFDKAVGSMAETITGKFMSGGRPACGIVYCLSRENCEKVAAELQVCAGLRMPACRGRMLACARGPHLRHCWLQAALRSIHAGTGIMQIAQPAGGVLMPACLQKALRSAVTSKKTSVKVACAPATSGGCVRLAQC